MKKKLFVGLAAMILPLLLAGCSSSNTLERPDDTNLTHWISETVSDADKAKMTSIASTTGGIPEYLDAKYTAIDDGNGGKALPLIHVSYLFTDGGDPLKEGCFVTSIHITDPTIKVYGLTMASTEAEVETKMESLGFKYEYLWTKGNFSFEFSATKITAAYTKS